MDFLKQLRWRYSTKQFDPKRLISKRDMHILLESLRLSPSSYGLQPWTFVIVDDPKIRAKLKDAAYDQDQVTDASHFVVLCAKTELKGTYVDSYIADIAKTRGKSVSALSHYRDLMTEDIADRSAKSVEQWNINQVYLALGFLLATAAYMGVDACPLEGFKPKEFEKILGLKKRKVKPVVAVALGYRLPHDRHAKDKKVRFSAKKVTINK